MSTAQDELEVHGPVLVAAGVLAGLGWLGLIVLILATLPTVFPRWLFFSFWLMALTGSAVPFVRLLNRRFSRADDPPAPGGVVLRQSLWVGLFGATCAWLQIGRVLNPLVAVLFAAGLGAIEWFLRARERSRRPAVEQPNDGQAADEAP